jgi:hypothetical protein
MLQFYCYILILSSTFVTYASKFFKPVSKKKKNLLKKH